MDKIALMVLAAIILQGCATYQVPDGAPNELATIQGHGVRTGAFEWEHYRIEEVDQRSVSYVFRSETSYKIPTTPGPHSFLILGEFNRGFGGACPCQAYFSLETELEAGKGYKLNGRVDDADINLWIEEVDTGEAVSEVVTRRYQPSPRTIYVPIIIY